jgi:hypothetical protein
MALGRCQIDLQMLAVTAFDYLIFLFLKIISVRPNGINKHAHGNIESIVSLYGSVPVATSKSFMPKNTIKKMNALSLSIAIYSAFWFKAILR